MNYKVTLDGYAIGNERLAALCLPPIPSTTQIVQLNPNEGGGKIIYHGYLEMREHQKTNKAYYPYKINLTEHDSEVDKFKEAINIFLRFLAGEGRDNCNQVTRIEPILDEDEAKFLDQFDKTMDELMRLRSKKAT